MDVALLLQKLEVCSEQGCDAGSVMPLDRQATASLRTIRRERGDHRVPSGCQQRTGHGGCQQRTGHGDAMKQKYRRTSATWTAQRQGDLA